ncbi:DUF433 domain-containing protein [Prosthecobacter sp.]|uniref:DUF433 domain-containing protein n=1 Tax=Prosthecobacter sp. TaxID=1965333 RepID=UPI002ABCC5A9|nr:DUF433 domain-containing protein [Prosthecobacter sp.]MDZ4406281.1 DUF433 domain-containing protein [Prosthecobacter sp.]
MITLTDLPLPLRGVFAFLDTVLPPETREAFATTEINKDQPGFLVYESFTGKTQRILMDTFQLMNGCSPVCQFLEEFHLFHETDMATALTWAYGLHQRGKDPLEALRADYAFRWEALLSWMTNEQINAARSRRPFCEHQPRTKLGDRWARCETYWHVGTIVLRGDRLVCHQIECYLDMDTEMDWLEDSEWAKFQALGGTEAFLAGKFEWPPIRLSMTTSFDDVRDAVLHLRKLDQVRILSLVAKEVADAHPGIDFQDNICGGSARISRTRIAVWLLEALRRGGRTDAELLAAYPSLTAEDLANAWNYARTHREEMEREIAANGDDA